MIKKMPEEYKGITYRNGGYTNSNPRTWTKKELEWVESMIEMGYTNKEIAESIDRTLTSVAIKVKRLGKKNGTYNANHIEDKYKTNEDFFNIIKPKTVLDCFCGVENFYLKYVGENLISNDIDKNIKANYNLDALKCLCTLYPNTFDLIDLDPYGSAYDCFDLAIKMATKAIVITFGELGHKRWRRLDFVSRHYGINTFEDFTLDNMIKHIQMIGRRNKKNLIPIFIKEWKNTGRVWFRIEPFKITEQWENKVQGR